MGAIARAADPHRLGVRGLLRPAFEVQLDGPNRKTLTPNANPATGGNPLCLFLKKNLILKPGQLVVL